MEEYCFQWGGEKRKSRELKKWKMVRGEKWKNEKLSCLDKKKKWDDKKIMFV